jgi:hypothetical protein
MTYFSKYSNASAALLFILPGRAGSASPVILVEKRKRLGWLGIY